MTELAWAAVQGKEVPHHTDDDSILVGEDSARASPAVNGSEVDEEEVPRLAAGVNGGSKDLPLGKSARSADASRATATVRSFPS